VSQDLRPKINATLFHSLNLIKPDMKASHLLIFAIAGLFACHPKSASDVNISIDPNTVINTMQGGFGASNDLKALGLNIPNHYDPEFFKGLIIDHTSKILKIAIGIGSNLWDFILVILYTFFLLIIKESTL
jgi:hypothetical protein